AGYGKTVRPVCAADGGKLFIGRLLRPDRWSNPAEGPNGWKWGVETRLSTAPRGRQAVQPVLHATLKSEAGRRGTAGTEAQSRMLVSKPRRPPLLREQVFAQSAEPPDTDPYVRWCGRGGVVRLPPIPIFRARGPTPRRPAHMPKK